MENNIVLAEGQRELVIREGQALPLKEPQVINLSGVIDSPLVWLQKRIGHIQEEDAHIIVDRENLSITLVIDEDSAYKTVIKGSGSYSDVFKRFAVNSGNYITNFEMAQLIKMNRSFFENHDVAMNLVNILQNFKAKVDKEIEKSDNNRGDKRLLVAQVVQSNLPERFNLCMPIFKGTPRQTFEVEVYIRAEDFSCTLISPAVNDLIESYRDQLIDDVLKPMREVSDKIPVIEV